MDGLDQWSIIAIYSILLFPTAIYPLVLKA
jgi:hypothetical protein